MSRLNPFNVKPYDLEGMNQAALFSWLRCAAWAGIEAADDPGSYSRELEQWPWADDKRRLALLWAHSVPNGVWSNPLTIAAFKAQGLTVGIPDVVVPWPGTGNDTSHGLYIELKRAQSTLADRAYLKKAVKAGIMKEKQNEALDALQELGYKVRRCWGWLSARDEIKNHLGF